MTKLITKFGLGFLILFFNLILSNAQPVIDGDLSDADYISIATKQNSNSGFGSDIDVNEILYYSDLTNSKLYIGVKGKLNTTSNNAIGLFLNFSDMTGVSSGTALGFPGAGNYMDGEGGGANDDFKADFEVDYMLAINPGNGASSAFLDLSKIVGGNTAEFQGASNQSGGTHSNPNVLGTGAALTFAFNNGAGANQGFEIVFDYAALGISAPATTTMEAFAFVVSATGFFSDVTVPGNITTPNPGFNADFSTLGGGDFHNSPVALPVELISFTASTRANNVILNWTTASETNNSHFEIEKSGNAQKWSPIGFVNGHGTTSIQNSYSFQDSNVKQSDIYYRLKQTDFDGRFEYSNTVIASIDTKPSVIYPNPVKDQLFISFDNYNADGYIEVYSTQGILLQKTAISNNEITTLNCQDFPKGIYLLNICDGNGNVKNNHRFVKN